MSKDLKWYHRWEWMGGQDIGDDDDPYLDRLRLIVTPFFSVYLHHIHRSDDDRAMHDHPWSFVSLVLVGSYTELIARDKYTDDTGDWDIETHRRFSWHRFPVKSAHTIVHIERPLWTLVFAGLPVNANWGFYPEPHQFVPWRKYARKENIVAGFPKWEEEGKLR